MTETRTPAVITVHSTNIAELTDKVAKINARLERNGIDARFSFAIIPGEDEVFELEDGTVSIFHQVAFNHAELVLGGYEFVGRVVIEDGGTIVSLVPGQSIQGFERPDAHRCDHCNVNRERVTSFLLRNTETGEISQVGSTCLELFLGVEVKGLWALGHFTAEELAEYREVDLDREPGQRRGEERYDTRYLIALGYVLSDEGKNFVSKTRASEWDTQSTASAVFENIHFRPFGRNAAEQAAAVKAVRDAARALPEELVTEILAFAETLSDSDYADNAKIAARSAHLSRRSVGVLLSLIGGWHRAKGIEAERKANPIAPGFAAEVGTKLKGLGIKVTVTKLQSFETAYGISTLVLFRTEAGNVCKWFASNPGEIEAGQEFTITGGSVKAHENYQGVDQTVVTRLKLAAA